MSSKTELTEKQAIVMELVYQGLNSKEIAQRLGIAPTTVDQRADGARKRLGAGTRIEAARIYAAHQGISERFIYSPSPLIETLSFPAQRSPPQDDLRFEDAFTFDERASWDRSRSWRSPDFRPRDFGVVARLLVIVALAVFIMLAVSQGLVLARSLGVMFEA